MYSKFRLAGYGGFVLGLGAIAMAWGACASDFGPEAGKAFGCAGGGSVDNCAGSGGQGGIMGPLTTGGTGGGGGELGVGGGGGVGAGHDDFPPSDGGTDAQGGGGSGDPPDASPPAIPPACLNMDMMPYVVYMSADDSNSMGSPGHIREIINDGFEPNPARIRTYEFLNYYRIAYQAADPGKLSIFPEMEKTAEPAIADFQIAVRSFDAPASRRPMNFTFLVDTSGSMKGPGIERAKAAVAAIASQFVQGDIVSFITTDATSMKLDGHIVTAPNDPALLSLVNGLTTGGNTDLLTALTEAYKLAADHRADNRMNRVIFISDGGVNVGVTDTDLIAEKSADADKEGIYLVGIGTGPALSYNDKLMNDITEAGRGAYVYLDSKEEAKRILADRFDETMDIAARAVQVELTLPWYFKVEGISTETQLSNVKVEPQHLAPNDAMVFFLKTTACDASFYNSADPVGIRVFWKNRQTYKSELTEIQVPLKSLLGGNSPTMAKGRAIVAYAEALKGCGFDKDGFTLCKDDTERKMVTKEKLSQARELANLAKAGMPDAELDEIIQIINIHPLNQ